MMTEAARRYAVTMLIATCLLLPLAGAAEGEPAPAQHGDREETATADAAEQEQVARYVGYWRVVDLDNEPFFLELREDLTAHATGLDGRALTEERQGTWRLDEEGVLVSYHSGAHDRLLVRPGRAIKLSYAAGRPLDARPNGMAPAVRLEADEVEAAIAAQPNLVFSGTSYVLSEKSF